MNERHRPNQKSIEELKAEFAKAKTRFDLLPPEALAEMARVVTYGSLKYAENLWQDHCRQGLSGEFFGAMLRHINAYQRGEDRDSETGILHMAHAAINAMFVIWDQLRFEGGKPSSEKGTIDFTVTVPDVEKIVEEKLAQIRDEEDEPIYGEIDGKKYEIVGLSTEMRQKIKADIAKIKDENDIGPGDIFIDGKFVGKAHSCTIVDEAVPKKTKLYVAGPMRGYKEHNFPAFKEATAYLRDRGYEAISPAERDIEMRFDPNKTIEENGFDVEDALKADFKFILDADGIVLLPGWRKSDGARAEFLVAAMTGKKVFYLGKPYGTGPRLDPWPKNLVDMNARRMLDGIQA